MGETQDKVAGRLKQAEGSLTGDDSRKHEGEREERKGKAKQKLNDGVDAVQDTMDDLKDRASRA